MTQLDQDAEALRKLLAGLQDKMTACYASMDQLRSDRTKRIDALKQKLQELNQKEVQFNADVAAVSSQKTSIEQRLDGLLKQKSHIEFSISFLTQRDPSLPEVKVEITEDIQPAMRRFRAQISSLEQEIQTVQKRLEGFNESIKQAEGKMDRNRLEVKNVKSELEGLALDPRCSEQFKVLTVKQRGLIEFCCTMEEKLNQVLRKSRLLLLDTYQQA